MIHFWLNIIDVDRTRDASPEKRSKAIMQREFTREEDECIQNVFDFYMKKTICRSVQRAVLRQMRMECRCIAVPDEEMSIETEVVSMEPMDVIEVRGYMIPFNNEKLYLVLFQLNEKEREIMLLNICEQIPLKEISKLMDMDYGATRVHKSRGLKKIKELLKRYGL